MNKSNMSDYNGVYKEIAETFGEEFMLKLFRNYRGQHIHFPMRLYSREYVEDYIKTNFDGNNVRLLSRELGYSERWVQRLIIELGINGKDGEM